MVIVSWKGECCTNCKLASSTLANICRPLFGPLVGRKANAANDAYIVGVRDRMREALEAAAAAGDLPFANAQLADFAEGGEEARGVSDLESEDEEQED